MGMPTALSHRAWTYPLWHGPTGKMVHPKGTENTASTLGVWGKMNLLGEGAPCTPTAHPSNPTADPAGAVGSSHPSCVHTGPNMDNTQRKLPENKAVTAIPCLPPRQNKRVLLCHLYWRKGCEPVSSFHSQCQPKYSRGNLKISPQCVQEEQAVPELLCFSPLCSGHLGCNQHALPKLQGWHLQPATKMPGTAHI